MVNRWHSRRSIQHITTGGPSSSPQSIATHLRINITVLTPRLAFGAVSIAAATTTATTMALSMPTTPVLLHAAEDVPRPTPVWASSAGAAASPGLMSTTNARHPYSLRPYNLVGACDITETDKVGCCSGRSSNGPSMLVCKNTRMHTCMHASI